MALIGRVFSSSEFTYVPESRCFVGEASDFARGVLTGRVWDDSADRGFVMEGAITGKRVVFLWTGDKRDREGELLYDVFLPYGLRGEKLKGGAAGIELKLFND